MNKTKRKALHTALILFNQQGLSQVSLRTIALEMGISQGNLAYHFKKREDILETLYFELVSKIDDSMSKVDPKQNIIQLMFEFNNRLMLDFFEYRFILIDFVAIIRTNETIGDHYKLLVKKREEQFAFIFDQMINQGLMRPEHIENEYKNLYYRFQILGNFWLSSSLLESEHIDKNTTTHYAKIIGETIIPYLTEKGLELYKQIINKA